MALTTAAAAAGAGEYLPASGAGTQARPRDARFRDDLARNLARNLITGGLFVLAAAPRSRKRARSNDDRKASAPKRVKGHIHDEGAETCQHQQVAKRIEVLEALDMNSAQIINLVTPTIINLSTPTIINLVTPAIINLVTPTIINLVTPTIIDPITPSISLATPAIIIDLTTLITPNPITISSSSP
ncbi:hypothetical protein MMC07_000909 [Pseudocyphellaria aurata]|nr:hypothetical protein [Pseudocyphellaria aurata]